MLIDDIAVLLTVVWACWCVLSVNVKDGIVGRVAYSSVALFGSVVLLNPARPDLAATAYHLSFALLGVRHYLITMHWDWFRAVLLRYDIEIPHSRRKGDA